MNKMTQFVEENLTNVYPIVKTIRTSLTPEQKTKEILNKWIAEIDSAAQENNLLFKDQKIKESYTVLKRVLDKLHQEFINSALKSDKATSIDFAPYFKLFREKANSDKTDKEEEELRKNFKKVFDKIEIDGTNLFDQKVLEYLNNNAQKYATEDFSKEELQNHIANFERFYSYLSGYNTNRKNYYETEKEQSTAIASRIVHENLPKFCNNILRYEKHEQEYVGILDWLKEHSKETLIKNTEKGEFEEATPISNRIFKIEHFNHCLTQDKIDEYNTEIGKCNYLINLYNQAKKQENKKFNELPKFISLFKQIGSPKNNFFISLIADFEKNLTIKQQKSTDILSVERLLSVAKEAGEKYFGTEQNDLPNLTPFTNFLKSCDNWKGFYWNKAAMTNVSNKYFANWHSIKDKLKDKKACVTYDKNQEDPIKLRDAIELSEMFEVLDSEKNEYLFKPHLIEEGRINCEIAPSKNIINLLCEEIDENRIGFTSKIAAIDQISDYKDDNNKTTIKQWLDHATNALRIVRYFVVRANKMKGNPANSNIQILLDGILNNAEFDWFKSYDILRNYLTTKPYDLAKEHKLKLNFSNSQLLNGFVETWKSDGTISTQYGAYIFRKKHPKCNEFEYYLGISKKTSLFKCKNKYEIPDNDKSEFQRLDYYQISPKNLSREIGRKAINKNIYNLIIPLLQELDTNNVSEEDLKLKESILLKKNSETKPSLQYLYNQISKSDFYSKILKDKDLNKEADNIIKLIIDNSHKFTRLPKIDSLLDKEYKGYKGLTELLNDFDDVITENKLFEFFPVSETEFNEHNGKDLYLFKISNKDLSYCDTHSAGLRENRGKENLHTMLFRALMHEDGYGDNVDLGTGEIFFRSKSIDWTPEVWEKGHHIDILKDKFKYPIISNKRFALDKFLFHLSITLNFRAKKPNDYEINKLINDTLKSSNNLNFIGIDRGEKHLVYSCIINNDCKILECKHYDEIRGTNYVAKLEELGKINKDRKRNWKEQDSIKSLKDGYISHVIHHLTNCVVKDSDGTINPHAYIVLEDLNASMKQQRQKIDKQVYQKLETALAKKLNYVVDKDVKLGEIGSVSKALQLTPPISNYQDIENKKQFGAMLYTNARYTSITDPATGWRQTIYLKNGNNESIKEQILSKFTDFGFDGQDYFFEYTEPHAGKTWRMYSGKDGKSLTRYRNKRGDHNEFIPEPIDVVSILNSIFKDFDKNKSFKLQIEEGKDLTKISDSNETAWGSLRYAIGIIQQIRNSAEKGSADDNFLLSPVRDNNGMHFDTRNHKNNGELSLIVDADANGAYNIARKGLIMNAHLNQNLQNPDLYISDEEWDMWLLDRRLWVENLLRFASPKDSKKKKK